MNSPTPSFPMEMEANKSWDSILEKAFKAIVPEEAPQNHVSVGVRSGSNKYALYNPHNYRLYFDFDKSTFYPKPRGEGSVDPTYKLINTSEVCFPDYLGYRIVVKKTQIELTRKEDRWHIINLYPVEGIRPQIQKIISDLNTQATDTLKRFILGEGGYSRLKILNMTSENKVKHENVIDTLPERMTFRNEIVKKVYMEQNVEFSDPVHASNYLSNSAIQEIAPDINNALKGISESLKAIVDTQKDMTQNALNPLTEQIRLHLKVQKETLGVLKRIGKELPNHNKRERAKELLKEWGW